MVVFGSMPDEKISTDAQNVVGLYLYVLALYWLTLSQSLVRGAAELARPALAAELLTPGGQVRGGGLVAQVTRFVDL